MVASTMDCTASRVRDTAESNMWDHRYIQYYYLFINYNIIIIVIVYICVWDREKTIDLKK